MIKHCVISLSIVALSFLNITASAETLTRGPYLQRTAPTSLKVRWNTDVATSSVISYGTSLTSLTTTSSDATSTKSHNLVVSGLQPLTKYYYVVGAIGAPPLTPASADQFFITAPAGGTVHPTRVWVLGDSGHSGTLSTGIDPHQKAVRDAYENFEPSRITDSWIMLGDNAYDSGTEGQYQRGVFNVYPSILKRSPLWPTRGNHDANSGVFYDLFSLPRDAESGGIASYTESFYSYDYSNIHFICLNSQEDDATTRNTMLSWLTADLAANTKDWTVAYWHHPAYTLAHHNSDNDADSEGKMGWMRQNVLPILENGGVDLVLTGHSHSYERSYFIDGHYGLSSTFTSGMKKNAGDGAIGSGGAYMKSELGPRAHSGTVYAVNGTGGRPVYPANGLHPVMLKTIAQYGSMVLDFNVNRLKARFVNETGQVLDSFDIIKKPTLPAPVEGLVYNPSISCSGASLSWNSLGAGTTYRIYRSLDSYKRGDLLAQNISTNSYIDSTAEVGKPYYYSIQAVNNIGVGALSAALSVSRTLNDTDHDGKNDCEDACPADPAKIEPGVCGCGQVEYGLNSHGTANCSKPLTGGYIPGKPSTTKPRKGRVTLTFDTFSNAKVTYIITIADGKTTTKFTSSTKKWTKRLSKGIYTVSYKIKSGKLISKPSKKVKLIIR